MKETELITFELVGQEEQYIIWVSSAAKKKKKSTSSYCMQLQF